MAAAGVVVLPELMVPLVGLRQELAAVRERIVAEAEAVIAETGTAVEYTVGDHDRVAAGLRHGGCGGGSGGLLLVRKRTT